jgi:hypothetical protein
VATQPPATQDDQKVPLDDEAKRLQLEKTKAEARKAIAEAQKATLAAQLPTSETKPLEGKVDVGAGVGLIAELLAYKLLGPAAATIAAAVKNQLGKDATASILVVEDRGLVASDWPYGAIREQLKSHDETLDVATAALMKELGEKAPPTDLVIAPALGAATAFVGAAAALVGMFRTDYSIASKEVTIGTTPLVAAVAQHLLTPKIQVSVDQFALVDESAIIKEFWATRMKRVKLERLSLKLKTKTVQPAERRIEDLRAEWKDAWTAYSKALGEATSPPKLEELERRMSTLEGDVKQAESDAAPARGLVAQADAVIAQFDGFATTATTATKEGSYPPLVAAALREALHGDTPKQTHVLYVAVEGSGGETVTRRSLFRRSGQVGFMGGTQVSYLLLHSKENKVVLAGTETLLGHLQYDLNKGEAGAFARVNFDV